VTYPTYVPTSLPTYTPTATQHDADDADYYYAPKSGKWAKVIAGIKDGTLVVEAADAGPTYFPTAYPTYAPTGTKSAKMGGLKSKATGAKSEKGDYNYDYDYDKKGKSAKGGDYNYDYDYSVDFPTYSPTSYPTYSPTDAFPTYSPTETVPTYFPTSMPTGRGKTHKSAAKSGKKAKMFPGAAGIVSNDEGV